MLFIIAGRDHPNGIDKRLEFRPQHRAHYEALGDDLILSGPFLDADGEPIGSMIIMRRDSQAAADAHVAVDPYVTENVFKTVRVDRWEWFMNRPDGLQD
ncbi:YciI family protein [Halovulum marinum]|nr:YciI family protein [Halovulum marinum]